MRINNFHPLENESGKKIITKQTFLGIICSCFFLDIRRLLGRKSLHGMLA